MCKFQIKIHCSRLFIPLFLLAFFPKHFFSSSGFPKVLPFFNVGSCSSSCALPLLHFPNIGCCSSSCLPKFAFFTLALPFFRLFLFALFFNFFLYVYVILVGRNSTVAIVGVMVSSSLHFGCVSLLALYIFGTPHEKKFKLQLIQFICCQPTNSCKV